MMTAPIPVPAPVGASAARDADRATAVLTLAFSTDPVCRWVWPDPQRYLANFPSFAWAFGGAAFRQGTAFCTLNYGGAALWLPPGITPDGEALGDLLQRTVAEQDQAEVFAFLEQMDRYHPTEPHWYLPLIGVDPALQGRSHGSALLQQALTLCDRDGMPAYLESSNPRNNLLYQRHGFEVLGRIQAGASPPMFPMLRTPR
jgi:ribosomal protein S18 acetylase RimI-like enzyme